MKMRYFSLHLHYTKSKEEFDISEFVKLDDVSTAETLASRIIVRKEIAKIDNPLKSFDAITICEYPPTYSLMF